MYVLPRITVFNYNVQVLHQTFPLPCQHFGCAVLIPKLTYCQQNSFINLGAI